MVDFKLGGIQETKARMSGGIRLGVVKFIVRALTAMGYQVLHPTPLTKSMPFTRSLNYFAPRLVLVCSKQACMVFLSHGAASSSGECSVAIPCLSFHRHGQLSSHALALFCH